MIKTAITIKNREKGAALLLCIILIFSIVLIISAGLTSLTLNGLDVVNNKIKSVKSYYAAEAGIEDSLLRLKNDLQISSPNVLTIEDNSAIIEITDLIGGSRTITSQGDTDNRIRKLSVVYSVETTEVSFFYGAQVGEGGMTMGNNSRIQGNVFSNGSILPSGGGTSEITDTAIIALNGNIIESVNIGKDVYVYSCKNSDIEETLYYVSGGSITNCDYENIVDLGTDEIEAKEMPISPEQIIDWKNGASSGGAFAGNYTIEGGETISLGPIKITGNLLIENNAVLNITGLIHVQGNITISNNAIIKLDGSFGSQSGVIISDGRIAAQNGAILQGSGQENSFLMLLSTNNSIDPASPAIDVSNNAQAAIFYASNGMIYLHNNINIKEATGYKLKLDNGAIISYDIGLENVNFSSGPGGSWQIESWQEIE